MNKKIIAGIGCLILLPILIVVVIGAIIIGGLYFGSKSTVEFTCAMSITKKSDKAIEALGENITDGYFIMPRITIEGTKREAYISIPVSGSKSSGTLYVSSYRDSFRNDFSVFLESGEKKIPIHKGTFPCTE